MTIKTGCGACLVVLAVLMPAQVFTQVVQLPYVELSPQDRARLDALAREQAREQARQDAEYQAMMMDAKATLLRSAPLPAARNPLLGQWRVLPAPGSGKKDDLGQLLGILNNPGRTACAFLFGEGITEFKSATWSTISSLGDNSLGPIQYRGDGKRVWAVPEGSKSIYFMPFDVISADSVSMAMIDDCPMVRVGAPATGGAPPRAPARGTTANPVPGPGATPNRAAATPPPAAPPEPATATRPSREICVSTFIDKLGVVEIKQVRQVLDLRFRESQQGPVPNSTLTRVEARGSACDDPRVSSMLYDFDANGMLQAVTMVWTKTADAAAGTLFAERMKSLSVFYKLPAPQAGRLEADIAFGRLIVQDAPAQNQVFETYAAKK